MSAEQEAQQGNVPMTIASSDDLQKARELLSEGLRLIALGKNEEALVVYEETTRLDPENSQAFNSKGNVLFWLGRNEEALQAFDEAIRLNPADGTVLGNKGITLYRLGRDDEARAALEEGRRLKEGGNLLREDSESFEREPDDDLKFHEDSKNSGWDSDQPEYHARRHR